MLYTRVLAEADFQECYIRFVHAFLNDFESIFDGPVLSRLRFVGGAVDGTRQSPRLFSHVLESQQFDVATLKTIFQTADEMQQCVSQGDRLDLLQGRIMATLFYEPSTRTR